MNRKEIISRVLAENSSETVKSPEELEAMLNEELSKPENEIDYDLVDQLVTGTLEARGISLTESDIEDKRRALYERNRKANCFKMPKWFISAAAACLILVCGNIYTVSAWDMNVFSFIVEFTKGGAIIDFSGTPDEMELPTSDDDPYGIIAVCRENGINIETPHYLPDGFVLTTFQAEPDKKYVSMTYKRNKNDKAFINLTFSDFSKRFLIPSDEHNLSEIKINGHDAVMSREDNQMVVVFSSSDSMLTIMTQDVDYDECDKILKEMR